MHPTGRRETLRPSFGSVGSYPLTGIFGRVFRENLHRAQSAPCLLPAAPGTVERPMPHAEQHPRGPGTLLMRSILVGRRPRLVARREGAEKAVRFVVGAGRKVDLVRIATIAAVPNNQRP